MLKSVLGRERGEYKAHHCAACANCATYSVTLCGSDESWPKQHRVIGDVVVIAMLMLAKPLLLAHQAVVAIEKKQPETVSSEFIFRAVSQQHSLVLVASTGLSRL